MTTTESDTIDIGNLAVLAEGYATPDTQVVVEITAVDDAPSPLSGGRAWEIPMGAERVVLLEVAQASETVTGVIPHLADALETPAAETTVDACDAPMVGTVLVIGDGAGPALIAFVATAGQSAAERRDDADLDAGLLSLGMLRDVPLEVSAELGHARMSVAEILQLQTGSTIELDRTAGAPVDVVVNGSLIARGEVVVIDDEYGIRITEIIGRIGDAI